MTASGNAASGNEEDFIFECSEDEELAQLGICFNNNWMPFPEEIEELYEQVRKNKYIPLLWQSPGHRDPHQLEKPVSVEPEQPSPSTQKNAEADDFDFEDETPTSMLKLPSKASSGVKSNPNKKRTTTLAGILSNMERHRIIEQRDVTSGGEKETKSTTLKK